MKQNFPQPCSSCSGGKSMKQNFPQPCSSCSGGKSNVPSQLKSRPNSQGSIFPPLDSQGCGPHIEAFITSNTTLQVKIYDTGYSYTLDYDCCLKRQVLGIIPPNTCVCPDVNMQSNLCCDTTSVLELTIPNIDCLPKDYTCDSVNKEYRNYILMLYVLSGFVFGVFDSKWTKKEKYCKFIRRLELSTVRNFLPFVKRGIAF